MINPNVAAIETVEKAVNSGNYKKLKKVISKKQLEEAGYEDVDQVLDLMTAASALGIVDGEVTLLQGYRTPADSDNNSTIFVMEVYKDGKDYSVDSDEVELYVDKGKEYLSINN
ncbi:hypothetical protein [Butyrivibrio proteoclasticus]|uniref:hypothetical protein n=1 Tax=Butyrivibrio proteoclasticus TaxID=43305 RepID=UPI000AED8137|nr:hypothetical protein [Butyrivibrio proteoclasticus]